MNKTFSYIAFAVACVFGLIALDTCGVSQRLSSDLNLVTESNKKLVQQRLSDSSSIYSMSVRIAYSEKVIHDQNKKLMAFEIMNMRRPKEIIGIGTKTNTSFSVQLPEPVRIDTSTSTYLKLPVPISDSGKWHMFSGRIDLTGKFIVDSLVTRANFTYAVGDTIKRGLINRVFRNSETVVRLRIDNPNVQLTGFENIYIKDKKRWYQRPGVMMACGFLAGVTTTIIVSSKK